MRIAVLISLLPVCTVAMAASFSPNVLPDPGFEMLSQNRDRYAKGCPWSCRYSRPGGSYEGLELPETRRWLAEYALIRHLHAPNDLAVMERYIAAFDKVFSQLDLVLQG